MSKFGLKILLYSKDGIRLGHLRRNVNVAHELSRLMPDTKFLFITDSPIARFFRLPINSSLLKLPTLVKIDEGLYTTSSKRISNLKNISIKRSKAIREVVQQFSPNIFLVEHLPKGALGELTETLAYIRMNSPQTKTILGLRDIIGASETIVSHWRSEDIYSAMKDYYDLIIIYGCKDIYDPVAEYDFPEELRQKTRYSGYVCNGFIENPISNTQFNSMFSEKRPFNVLVEGGGGSDAYFLMDVMLDAISYLGSAIPFNTFMITGPFMPSGKRRDLIRRSEGMPVVVRHMDKNSLNYLEHSDLVVSMAGYNTVCEILEFGKRSIIIPRSGQGEEQITRSRIFENLGLVSTIPPEKLEPKILAERIVHKLNENHKPYWNNLPSLNGASYTARLLLEQFYTDSLVQKKSLSK